MRTGLLAAAACALLLTGAASAAQAAPASCATQASDGADVTKTVQAFFDAIQRADIPAAKALTSPSFHAFDVGKHFTGPELFAMVGGAQQRGATLTFGLGPIETHVDCDFAWAVWQNDGKINTTPTLWLESAMLRRTPEGWRFEFYHSTKVEPPK